MSLTVNRKKPLRLKNNTKYFSPDTSRSHVVFSSPYSYSSRQMKIEGYENRLYWQYRYCEDLGGQTFFYTLTYNNTSMPNKYGMNCFDYEDLRDLLTGGFRKQLLRKYGTSFKYFIGAELGDGKGVRGLHNNPHYHILFFLEPCPFKKSVRVLDYIESKVAKRSSKFHKKGDKFEVKHFKTELIDVPYKVISPEEFRHLVRLYWQGFDEDVVGFRDYNLAKYGIATEGLYCGKVLDFRACMYCSKYVSKDVKLVENEDVVRQSSRALHEREYLFSCDSYDDFFDEVINPSYNVPSNFDKTSWCFSDEDLCRRLIPDLSEFFSISLSAFSKTVYSQAIIQRFGLDSKYNQFVSDKIDSFVNVDLNIWRNRYSNKCRISHGVGDYAFTQIVDPLNPSIKVPSKDGFKVRPLNLYYFRKLFTNVVKDAKGSNIYVLNDLGKQYKLSSLASNLSKCSCTVKANLSCLNEDLFSSMVSSDVNTDVTFNYISFSKSLNRLSKQYGLDVILNRYAEYKRVYEDRFFSFKSVGSGLSFYFPSIDVYRDYSKFLVPSFYTVSRSDLRLDSFLDGGCKNYLPYSSHPYFLPFISIFAVFDLLSDYFYIQKDNEKQKEAERIANIKRFHDTNKLKSYYSKFVNY